MVSDTIKLLKLNLFILFYLKMQGDMQINSDKNDDIKDAL